MDDVNATAIKQITESAREVLRPLGMFQKGRPRIWLADNTWWMVVVEFQTGGMSKGFYLNVGCMWLWNVKSYLSFDEGYRVDKFHRFESASELTAVAEQVSQRAADEVLRYQSLFPSIRAVSDYYLRHPPPDSFWPEFNAAIAHVLSGRDKVGAALLSRKIGKMNTSIEWQKNAALDAELLLAEIPFPDRFKERIEDRILQSRKLHNLQPAEEVNLSPTP
jgi:hypothetical protein